MLLIFFMVLIMTFQLKMRLGFSGFFRHLRRIGAEPKTYGTSDAEYFIENVPDSYFEIIKI